MISVISMGISSGRSEMTEGNVDKAIIITRDAAAVMVNIPQPFFTLSCISKYCLRSLLITPISISRNPAILDINIKRFVFGEM